MLRHQTTLPPKVLRDVDIFVEDYEPHPGENKATIRVAFSDAGRDMIMHYGLNALIAETLEADFDSMGENDNLEAQLELPF